MCMHVWRDLKIQNLKSNPQLLLDNIACVWQAVFRERTNRNPFTVILQIDPTLTQIASSLAPKSQLSVRFYCCTTSGGELSDVSFYLD